MLDPIIKQPLVEMDYVDIAGWIHIFDLVFELSWKSLRDYMFAQWESDSMDFTREVLQIWFARGYIENPSIWIEMLADRNNSTHEYNEDSAIQIIQNIQGYYIPEIHKLYEKLKQHI